MKEPQKNKPNTEILLAPTKKKIKVELEKGPNIQPLPKFLPLTECMDGPVLMKVENDISTDEILPAGDRVLPFRSNIPELSKFTFSQIDETYYDRALPYQKQGHFIIAGLNYGQGSSREHAAMAPKYLGVKAVIAKSYARIHWQNLVNFGILPLVFVNRNDYNKISLNDILCIKDIIDCLEKGKQITIYNKTQELTFFATYSLSPRQISILLEGGMINYYRKHKKH